MTMLANFEIQNQYLEKKNNVFKIYLYLKESTKDVLLILFTKKNDSQIFLCWDFLDIVSCLCYKIQYCDIWVHEFSKYIFKYNWVYLRKIFLGIRWVYGERKIFFELFFRINYFFKELGWMRVSSSEFYWFSYLELKFLRDLRDHRSSLKLDEFQIFWVQIWAPGN